ncbi:hypothetical protein T459_07501 [Capsicum annuum]|uniref:F-box domain-containing protein n=1 Tax=Capsicum annuum TaxID=4072 RepID=A0A2G2ZTU5_CAPAN|nr:F-box/kelch-repeat protein At3g06240 [Capsicum annuum]PHT85395.1 hypothetical protein T459_07501 [Capsicum annuum]
MENQIVAKIPTNISLELQQFSCLPDEIIIEILLRLPVKSLLKLRCVSKSLFFLLSSSQFMKSQINFCVKECKDVNFRLVVAVGKMCNIYSLGLKFGEVDFPLKHPFGSCKFLGSCNGLICLTPMSFKLMLWNPCTGKYKEFQDSYVQSVGSCYIRYGFGYDVVNDDFKVVKIFSFAIDEVKYENVVKIYSLRGDSWKIGEGFVSGYMNAQSGVFVNGFLHWEVSDCRGSGDCSEIMTLDLATETYGVMGFPNCEKGNVSWGLSVVGGNLVACCNYYPNRTDMWVMKEYGVEKSWTKLVSLLSPFGRMGYISPLFVSENGDEILVKLGTDISLYETRNASYKSLEIHSAGYRLQVQAITYIESLASPHVGDDW